MMVAWVDFGSNLLLGRERVRIERPPRLKRALQKARPVFVLFSPVKTTQHKQVELDDNFFKRGWAGILRVAVWGDSNYIPGCSFEHPLAFDLVSPALDHSGWAAHRAVETALLRVDALYPRATMMCRELFVFSDNGPHFACDVFQGLVLEAQREERTHATPHPPRREQKSPQKKPNARGPSVPRSGHPWPLVPDLFPREPCDMCRGRL